jgi:hypothetical protein
LPETLAQDFLFRRVHPLDPPNKTILQAIDVESGLRVDVFRSRSEIISRSVSVNLWSHTLRLISLEDLLARSAGLALDVRNGVPTPRKYATDFLRSVKLADASAMEIAWQDHRRPNVETVAGAPSFVKCRPREFCKSVTIDADLFLSREPIESRQLVWFRPLPFPFRSTSRRANFKPALGGRHPASSR